MNLHDTVEFRVGNRTKQGYICGVIRSEPPQYEARYDFNPALFRGKAEDFRLVKSATPLAANDA